MPNISFVAQQWRRRRMRCECVSLTLTTHTQYLEKLTFISTSSSSTSYSSLSSHFITCHSISRTFAIMFSPFREVSCFPFRSLPLIRSDIIIFGVHLCVILGLSLSANTHVRHTKTFDWLLIFYHFVCLTPRGHTIDFDEREPRKKEEEKESSDSSSTFSFNVCTQCVWDARKMPFGCLSHYYFRCGVDDCAEQFTSWAKKKKKKKDEIHRQKIRRLNHVEVFFFPFDNMAELQKRAERKKIMEKEENSMFRVLIRQFNFSIQSGLGDVSVSRGQNDK